MRYRLLLLPLVCGLILGTVGCSSKKAKLREREAFIAGQQQAMTLMRQSANQVHQIQIVGEVDNPTLQWTEGLTVSQAIVNANYRGFRDPQEIVIDRNGQMISINPKALLRGEDEPLQAGDRIILR